jgi:hypothetical protein
MERLAREGAVMSWKMREMYEPLLATDKERRWGR